MQDTGNSYLEAERRGSPKVENGERKVPVGGARRGGRLKDVCGLSTSFGFRGAAAASAKKIGVGAERRVFDASVTHGLFEARAVGVQHRNSLLFCIRAPPRFATTRVVTSTAAARRRRRRCRMQRRCACNVVCGEDGDGGGECDPHRCNSLLRYTHGVFAVVVATPATMPMTTTLAMARWR